MSRFLELGRELSDRSTLPFKLISGALIYVDETPSHRFTTIVAPILDGEYCVALPSRDFFDDSLAAAVLAFVTERESAVSPEKTLVLLEGFCCPPFSFDTVAILNPAAANQFEHENDVLNNQAFVAFPIYRCELSGNESADLVDTIRHQFLPSLDWKRSPCPKVTMAYRNLKNDTGSRPSLTKLTTAIFEAGELHESEGSWIELQNYAGRRCRVEWSQGQFTVEFPEKDRAELDHSQLIEFIEAFTIQDKVRPSRA